MTLLWLKRLLGFRQPEDLERRERIEALADRANSTAAQIRAEARRDAERFRDWWSHGEG